MKIINYNEINNVAKEMEEKVDFLEEKCVELTKEIDNLLMVDETPAVNDTMNYYRAQVKKVEAFQTIMKYYIKYMNNTSTSYNELHDVLSNELSKFEVKYDKV